MTSCHRERIKLPLSSYKQRYKSRNSSASRVYARDAMTPATVGYTVKGKHQAAGARITATSKTRTREAWAMTSLASPRDGLNGLIEKKEGKTLPHNMKSSPKPPNWEFGVKIHGVQLYVTCNHKVVT